MSCLASARYSMKADVLVQSTTRDPDTGETNRTWDVDRVISCQARGVVSGGIRVVGSTERFGSGGEYDDVDWVKMQTSERLTKRDRVSNIRNTTGTLWVDEDGNALTFEVLGVTPLPNPFGSITEYDVILENVQDG